MIVLAVHENLFSHVPATLFSLLTGSLKEIHSDLLFILYDQYRVNISAISRDLIVDMYTEYLESLADQSWTREEEGLTAGRSVRDRANLMLRKFVECGWVIQEPHFDYTFRLTLPDHSLVLLDAFHKIRTGYRVEFKGRVFSIYQNLTAEEGASYIALQQAAELTYDLVDGLKRLNHSIKKYTEKLLDAADAQEILEQMFDQYHVEILGEQYYRLKTSEHISRYRTAILAKVRDWQFQRDEIINQAQIMVKERQVTTRVDGENRIYEWLEFIEDSFGRIDDILEEIDRRNSQYARAAVERLRFQLHQGHGSQRQLATVLGYLAAQAKQEGEKAPLGEDVHERLHLFSLRVVDEFSVKTPPRTSHPHQPQPVDAHEVEPEVRQKKLRRFQERVAEEITIKQINDYVLGLLGDKMHLPLADVPLRTRPEWIRLIYIIVYSPARSAVYTLKGEHGDMVSLDEGAVEIPAFVIHRKVERK